MITKTDYNWQPMPTKPDRNLIVVLSDRSYCGSIDLLGPVRLFGRDNQYISVGPNWMINVLQSRGQNLVVKDRPTKLPAFVVNPREGYLIVPFGERMIMRTCGTMAKLWTLEDRTVIQVIARPLDTHGMISFQIHFLYGSEIIEVHYKEGWTSSKTVIGACGEPDEYLEWGCDAHEDLSETAIRIDTSVAEVIEQEEGPSGNWNLPSKPKPPVVDGEWVQDWVNFEGTVKVLVKI